MSRVFQIGPGLAAFLLGLVLGPCPASSQEPPRRPEAAATASARAIVLRPARVFDGIAAGTQAGWVVVVRGGAIDAAGPEAEVTAPEGARVIDLPGATLLPGLIDAH